MIAVVLVVLAISILIFILGIQRNWPWWITPVALTVLLGSMSILLTVKPAWLH